MEHTLPTTQVKTLQIDITRWSIPKSDSLYFLQPKMEKLYTGSEKKTGSCLVAQIMNTLLHNSSGKNHWSIQFCSVQLLSCVQLFCDPMNLSIPDNPVYHQLPESTHTHVHWVSDAIQPSHPLPSPSRPALNLSQHQGLFQWVSSSHQVAKVLEFQLQHQSFQWTLRTDLL